MSVALARTLWRTSLPVESCARAFPGGKYMVVSVTLPVALVLMLTETVLSFDGMPVSGVTSSDRFQAMRTPDDRAQAVPVAPWDRKDVAFLPGGVPEAIDLCIRCLGFLQHQNVFLGVRDVFHGRLPGGNAGRDDG